MTTIWVPPSFRGETPNYLCRLCGEGFLTPEGQARHVAKCYRASEGEIRMQALAQKAPGLFGDEGVDVEFIQWHKDHHFTKVD
jgi:hypothetical protein